MDTRKLVGMLIPDGTNQFFSVLAQQFQRELAQQHVAVVVMNSDGSLARERAYMELLISMELDGLAFISVGDSLDAYDVLRSFEGPKVVLDREVPILDRTDFVIGDNAQGVREAVQHLVSIGHTRIGCLSGSQNTEPGRVREEAFRDACVDLGLELDDRWIFPGDFIPTSGAIAGEQIIGLPEEERPTAVFAANDLMALGLIQSLQEHGFAIPDDFAVVGYDDIPMASWVFPRLTTVRQDVVEIARIAAQLLVGRMDEHPLGTETWLTRARTVAPRLVVRESTRRRLRPDSRGTP